MRCAEFGLNWSNDSREKDIYTQYKLHDKQVTSELTIKKKTFSFYSFPTRNDETTFSVELCFLRRRFSTMW